MPWRRVAATPRLRRGYSVETSRGDAAAGTWIFCGDESRRRRGSWELGLDWRAPRYRKSCVDYFQSRGIVVQAFKPLQRGAALEHPVVLDVAAAAGKTAAQVLVRWGIQKGLWTGR